MRGKERSCALTFLSVIFLLFWSVPLTVNASQDALYELGTFPSLVASVRLTEPVEFCGEPVPVTQQHVREQLEKVLLFRIWDRPQTILWLKRAGRYFPYMEKTLREYGLPDDLKYVAVVESSLKQRARSKMNAVGIWQFIRATGTYYKLTVNEYVDERRDFFASTRAAAEHFKDLYEELGSWTLCAAAYNMGGPRLGNAMRLQETRDYYNLYLPLETQAYMYKIIAVKILFENQEKFGFKLTSGDLYPPPTGVRVDLVFPKRVHMMAVAKAANTFYRTIRDMNPHVLNNSLPKGKHYLYLPEQGAEGFQARFATQVKTAPMTKYKKKKKKKIIYKVRRGDSLAQIAQKHKVSVKSILMNNKMRRNRMLYPGDKLVILRK